MSDLFAQLIQILSRWSGYQPGSGPTPAPQPDPTPVSPTPSATSTIVASINAARSSNGLSPLLEDAPLDQMASSWAQAMASGVGLSHGDFSGRINMIYPNTPAGEDIAEGQPDAASVVDAWMQSPPHRANILGAFNRVGAGSALDGNGNLYWCADFVQAG